MEPGPFSAPRAPYETVLSTAQHCLHLGAESGMGEGLCPIDVGAPQRGPASTVTPTLTLACPPAG